MRLPTQSLVPNYSLSSRKQLEKPKNPIFKIKKYLKNLRY